MHMFPVGHFCVEINHNINKNIKMYGWLEFKFTSIKFFKTVK